MPRTAPPCKMAVHSAAGPRGAIKPLMGILAASLALAKERGKRAALTSVGFCAYSAASSSPVFSESALLMPSRRPVRLSAVPNAGAPFSIGVAAADKVHD